MLVKRGHWVVISNKLPGDSGIIEVFDSLMDEEHVQRMSSKLVPESF